MLIETKLLIETKIVNWGRIVQCDILHIHIPFQVLLSCIQLGVRLISFGISTL